MFPIQRMGIEAWPIHTVQYSNHTQYDEGWTGQKFCAEEIRNLTKGLDNIGKLKDCQAVISGYLGSAEQCQAVADTVNQVKESNHRAFYVCDPVMGDPEKGCIVPEGVTEELTKTLMPMADVIVPNQFELAQFTGVEIHSLYDAVTACKKALELGPRLVLVKHLHSLAEGTFTAMLATPKACYLVQRPELDFEKAPVGVGDLITAIFTACITKQMSPVAAFRHTNNAVFGVLEVTQDQDTWELQTIAGQYEFIEPTHDFEPKKIA
ncbi:pyeidoxal kinase [Vibrio ishigakensis]|uniref:pyridoxal kinase n=1 Tax=Vibrio ishigakensis TaxID=1481914 RepID=A0A0B8P0Z0_9VIBR|nr:pyeidoxal kinase [Vibrio ishigakensis]